MSSRYYDPEVGRFISADTTDVLDIQSDLYDKNLYAYCDNNPVIREDDGGKFWNIVIGATVGAAISAITTAVDSYMTTGRIDWGNVAISAAVGAVSGGVAATGLGVITQASISAFASGAGSIVTDVYDRIKNPSAGKITSKECGRIALRAVGSAATGFGSSILGSAIGNGATKGLSNKADNMIFRGSRKVGYMTKSQARNLITSGSKLKNTAYGISSVLGTVFSWPFSTAISSTMVKKR